MVSTAEGEGAEEGLGRMGGVMEGEQQQEFHPWDSELCVPRVWRVLGRLRSLCWTHWRTLWLWK